VAKKVGRPTIYSPELAATICALLVEGNSLKSICRRPDMPDITSIYLWMSKYPEFSNQYARAREDQADTFADEILHIADEPAAIIPATGAVDSGSVAEKRLRIDARKWLASKQLPKKYGDKVTNEVIGQDGGPVKIEAIKRVIVDPGTKDT